MSDLVTRTDEDGLCTLTLNRPDKLNALNVPMFVQLHAHVDEIAGQTETVGCVVLRGAGRAFSAGHDLKDIRAGEKPPHPHFQAETVTSLANLPQPVIVAVHGHCYTGALELALAGDLLIASASATCGEPHPTDQTFHHRKPMSLMPRARRLAHGGRIVLVPRPACA